MYQQMKERLMAMDEHRTELEAKLGQAVDDLHAALQLAADATMSIKTLLPKVSAIAGMFDELDAVIRSGRQQVGTIALADAA
jgi:hypothetical protein